MPFLVTALARCVQQSSRTAQVYYCASKLITQMKGCNSFQLLSFLSRIDLMTALLVSMWVTEAGICFRPQCLVPQVSRSSPFLTVLPLVYLLTGMWSYVRLHLSTKYTSLCYPGHRATRHTDSRTDKWLKSTIPLVFCRVYLNFDLIKK